jgi:hypothetical protein
LQQRHNNGNGFDGADGELAVFGFHDLAFGEGNYYSLKKPIRHSGKSRNPVSVENLWIPDRALRVRNDGAL